MSELVGGYRAACIRESLFLMLRAGLTDLNWFNPSNPHSPIALESRPRNQNEPIQINTAALGDGNDDERDTELGSTLTEQTWLMWVDFFAENDSLGLHFIKDVRDVLRGRFTTTITTPGHQGPLLAVYDFRQPTPPIAFHCEIENVATDKAHGFLKPWLEHWYSCTFTLTDYYNTENG